LLGVLAALLVGAREALVLRDVAVLDV